MTLQVSHTNVGEHVVLEITLTRSQFPTLVTPQPCPTSIRENASCNGSFNGGRFSTMVTSVGPHAFGSLLPLVKVACALACFHATTYNPTFGSIKVVESVNWVWKNPQESQSDQVV